MKTSYPKPSPQAPFYVIDAKDKVLGRLSVGIATVLRGRHKASYVPHLPCGAHVIVLNAEKVKLTGAKMEQKTYYRHTGYFGSLRQTGVKEMLEKDAGNVIRLAVKGMMPKNAMRERILARFLHVYTGTEHDFAAQKPQPLPL